MKKSLFFSLSPSYIHTLYILLIYIIYIALHYTHCAAHFYISLEKRKTIIIVPSDVTMNHTTIYFPPPRLYHHRYHFHGTRVGTVLINNTRFSRNQTIFIYIPSHSTYFFLFCSPLTLFSHFQFLLNFLLQRFSSTEVVNNTSDIRSLWSILLSDVLFLFVHIDTCIKQNINFSAGGTRSLINILLI